MNLENMVLRELSQTQKDRCHINRPPQERQEDVQSHGGGKQDGELALATGQEGGADENNLFLAVKVFGNSSDGCSLVSAPSVPEWNSKMG